MQLTELTEDEMKQVEGGQEAAIPGPDDWLPSPDGWSPSPTAVGTLIELGLLEDPSA